MIKGQKKALTAEDLLRARYTAFTLHEVDFILDSHHSRTRQEIKREEVKEWAENSTWHNLKIVQKEAGAATDTQGTLVFCAEYTVQGKKEEHWEQALFEKENGDWKFLDARGVRQGPLVRTEPKVGRNDPCSCGSGKKFKKCHGA